jgi:hypothetical protein
MTRVHRNLGRLRLFVAAAAALGCSSAVLSGTLAALALQYSQTIVGVA